jgi:hypothetical protein
MSTSCAGLTFIVLVLSETVLVLVLDAVSSSTSIANTEYEYEKLGKTSIETPKHASSGTLAVGCGLNDCSCFPSDFVVLAIGQFQR